MHQLVGILIIVQFALSQQTQEGIPFSKIYDLETNYQIITLPDIDQDVLLEEDIYREMGTPFRYGYKHEVKYSPENSGVWEKTEDGGLIWKIHFTSVGAFAMSFEYNNFHIPKGGELYVYTPEYEMTYGAYTDLNNTESKHFATPLIKGDIVII